MQDWVFRLGFLPCLIPDQRTCCKNENSEKSLQFSILQKIPPRKKKVTAKFPHKYKWLIYFDYRHLFNSFH